MDAWCPLSLAAGQHRCPEEPSGKRALDGVGEGTHRGCRRLQAWPLPSAAATSAFLPAADEVAQTLAGLLHVACWLPPSSKPLAGQRALYAVVDGRDQDCRGLQPLSLPSCTVCSALLLAGCRQG